jgi:hypothetical protein
MPADGRVGVEPIGASVITLNFKTTFNSYTNSPSFLIQRRHLKASLQEGQAARFSLGPLYCSGAVRPVMEADSCESLWVQGSHQ